MGMAEWNVASVLHGRLIVSDVRVENSDSRILFHEILDSAFPDLFVLLGIGVARVYDIRVDIVIVKEIDGESKEGKNARQHDNLFIDNPDWFYPWHFRRISRFYNEIMGDLL